MLQYTIKRILTFIPMLIAISLIAFLVSINAPGDPVERLSKAAGNECGAQQESGASKKVKQELRKKLGLDLPIFYFSIGDISDSDTLYRVQDKYHKKNLEALTHQSGNWEAVSNYYHSLQKLQKSSRNLELITNGLTFDETKISVDVLNDMSEAVNQLNFEIGSLLETSEKDIIENKFKKLNTLIEENTVLTEIREEFNNLQARREE